MRCSKSCKHNIGGFCIKYNEEILESKNPYHPGLLIHPLRYLNLYYRIEEQEVSHLIDLAKRYLNDDVSKSICSYYEQKGQISYKQRKMLLYKIFDCYEEKERPQNDFVFCQVE